MHPSVSVLKERICGFGDDIQAPIIRYSLDRVRSSPPQMLLQAAIPFLLQHHWYAVARVRAKAATPMWIYEVKTPPDSSTSRYERPRMTSFLDEHPERSRSAEDITTSIASLVGSPGLIHGLDYSTAERVERTHVLISCHNEILE